MVVKEEEGMEHLVYQFYVAPLLLYPLRTLFMEHRILAVEVPVKMET